ncbi:hypothetical protein [Prochlorococcus marinus]|uniref:hypothetical protein n=1 Tax=Prochlorococcus marinus TaxID=1219 RepID=UPI0022B4ED1F|nr:hypothetical protein [Prochlorococcus marinus]
MTKKDILSILYVSIWVIIWGTVGSLIDFPLLSNNVYEAGSLGQAITFIITALISLIAGTFIFKNFSDKFLH